MEENIPDTPRSDRRRKDFFWNLECTWETLNHTPFQSQDIKNAQDIEKEIVQASASQYASKKVQL